MSQPAPGPVRAGAAAHGCDPERSPDQLRELRHQLDAVDVQLLACVRERLDCCRAIAEFKRVHGIPMMQPHRVRAAHGRAADFAHQHSISEDFLYRLYAMIIAETCRIEDEIIGGPCAAAAQGARR